MAIGFEISTIFYTTSMNHQDCPSWILNVLWRIGTKHHLDIPAGKQKNNITIRKFKTLLSQFMSKCRSPVNAYSGYHHKNLNPLPDDLKRSKQSSYMPVMSLHKALVEYLSFDSQLSDLVIQFARKILRSMNIWIFWINYSSFPLYGFQRGMTYEHILYSPRIQWTPAI